jgi:hypothetical protein
MKPTKIIYLFIVLLVVFSCGRNTSTVNQSSDKTGEDQQADIPLDK